MMGGAMMQEMMRNQGNMARGAMQGMAGSGMRGMMGGMGLGMGMGMGGGTESAGNYWRSEERRVMIRALDFTVERDTTYRYRVRIVVFNPNYHHDDVTSLTNTKDTELFGPWSHETDEVTMPPDIQPYTIGTFANAMGDTKVRFQVVRFHPDDGVTVLRNFEARPGEIIGGPKTTRIPVSDGSGEKNHTIDFTSQQIMLDASGGDRVLPQGLVGNPIEQPVLALLLRPDGSVVVHNEADDRTNEVRKDIESNYNHELKMSGKQRKNSTGTGMGMGGMMQMMMRGMAGRSR
jgi:hypothetical protein